MWEIKETSPSEQLRHGHAVTVTPSVAVPLTTTPTKPVLNRGIVVRAPGAGDAVPNVDTVWIGRAGVTPDQNVGTGGMPLLPGASMELPLDDLSQVYIVSLSANQDVAWMGA